LRKPVKPVKPVTKPLEVSTLKPLNRFSGFVTGLTPLTGFPRPSPGPKTFFSPSQKHLSFFLARQPPARWAGDPPRRTPLDARVCKAASATLNCTPATGRQLRSPQARYPGLGKPGFSGPGLLRVPKRSMLPCALCGKPLVPIGTARAGGAKHADWKRRKYHKACFKKLFPPKPKQAFKPRRKGFGKKH
jgi:hypothetical protein